MQSNHHIKFSYYEKQYCVNKVVHVGTGIHVQIVLAIVLVNYKTYESGIQKKEMKIQVYRVYEGEIILIKEEE